MSWLRGDDQPARRRETRPDLSVAAQQLPDKPSFSLTEAAYYIGVHVNTLRNWIDGGSVVVRRTEGGHYRIDRHELQKMLSKS